MGRFLWFGGQGSQELFSHSTVEKASADARSSSAAISLTRRCFEAWKDEVQSLDPPARTKHGLDGVFTEPMDFFKLDMALHTHGVVQSTTICLYQLLRLLSVARTYSFGYSGFLRDLSEVAGFCSGLLPAAVAACSSTENDLIDNGIEAFRLAFWIGVRSSIFSLGACGKLPPGTSYLLVVKNTSREEVQATIEHFNSQGANGHVNLAAVIGSNSFSVSGHPEDLSDFKAVSNLASRFAHVHTLYHGSTELTAVASKVLEDVQARGISFTEQWESSCVLRSTRSGNLLSRNEMKEASLIEFIIQQTLVETVEWDLLCEKFKSSLDSTVDKHVLHAIGPGSKLLLSTLQSTTLSSNISIIDESADPRPSMPFFRGPNDNSSDIAIVGIGARYPGGNDISEFWETILTAKDTVEPIPSSRFEQTYLSSKGLGDGKARSLVATHGSFLDDIWSFDARFFNVSPREAQSMDPQQRILLEVVQSALEDSGYGPSSSPSTRPDSIGCFIGVATGDYVHNLQNDIDVYYSTGTLRAFLSGKLSYAYKLSGPSVVIDTACSSSLVAIHQACQALQLGDCTMAIAGGVNTISSPDMYIGLDRAHFLSHTGGCKPFDAAADGYGRSEGCGVFVLKKLSDAIAENDVVHAVIKGSAINQNGLSQSITRPHAATQAKLFHSLLHKSGVTQNDVSYVETHGTGTQVGDATETESLRNVFGNRDTNNPLFLGTVKSSIGHSEAASGAAGLVKLCLMLRHRSIPPQRLTQLNPALQKVLTETMVIPMKPHHWDPPCNTRKPLTAMLNNFGAAGSNCALILQEYKSATDDGEARVSRSSHLLSVSATSDFALKELLRSYIEFLSAETPVGLADFSYTASVRRRQYENKLAFACESTSHAISLMSSALASKNPRPKNGKIQLAFVFSGQGSLYFGMGKEMVDTVPFVQQIIRENATFLRNLGIEDVTQYYRTSPPDDNSLSSPRHFVGSQCACVILEYAIAKFLISIGLTPTVVLGHSLGEYTALAVSEMLSIEDVLSVLVRRGELMLQHCDWDLSRMITCQLGKNEAVDFAAKVIGLENDVSVACDNSTKDCVLSASQISVLKLKEEFIKAGIKCKILDIHLGFHSKFVSDITEPLTRFCRNMNARHPKFPIFSNVTGERLGPESFNASYFALHACKTVRFTSMMGSVIQDFDSDNSVFIEVGPHPITLPMIKTDVPAAPRSLFIPTLRKDKFSWQTFTSSLAELINNGVEVSCAQVFDGTGAKLLPLPGHPMFRETYCVPYSESHRINREITKVNQKSIDAPLLWKKIPTEEHSPGKQSIAFEADRGALAKLIKGHVVGGVAICPASVYNELILEAAAQESPLNTDMIFSLSDVAFPSPLVYSDPTAFENLCVTVRILMDTSTSELNADVQSVINQGDGPKVHCVARVNRILSKDTISEWRKTSAMISRQSVHILHHGHTSLNTFTKSVLYDRIFTRVVRYASEYQTLQELKVLGLTLQGLGKFHLKDAPHDERMVAQPVFADTLLHASGFIANISVAMDVICVCTKVDAICILPEASKFSGGLNVYCSLLEVDSDELVADAYAFTADGRVVGTITGMHFKKLKLSALEGQFRRIAGLPSSSHDNNRFSVKNTTPVPQPLRGSESPNHSVTISTSSQGEIKQVFYNSLSKICGNVTTDLSRSQSLDNLGFDSLMLIELESELRGLLHGTGVTFNLTDYSLVGDLEDAVTAQFETQGSFSPPSLESNASQSSSQTELSVVDESMTAFRTWEFTKRVIADICSVPESEISDDVRLESVGIDSLLSLELADKLGGVLGTSVDPADIMTSETIGDIHVLCSAKGESTKRPRSGARYPSHRPEQPLLLHDSNSTNIPLVLVHDGSGLCTMYSKLGGLDRKLYGIQSSAFDELSNGSTVQQMASSYLSVLDQLIKQSQGIILGGWSFGGVVAYEMTCQAHNMGLPIHGLILIDSPPPIDHTPLHEKIIEAAIKTFGQHNSKKTNSRAVSSLMENFKRHALMLGQYSPSAKSPPIPVTILHSSETLDTKSLSGIDYPWLDDHSYRQKALQTWAGLLGQNVSIRDIKGNHFNVFHSQNIKNVTDQLHISCRAVDSNRQR